MKCPRCQFDNPAETNYCGKCGLPLFRPEAEGAAGPTLTLETPVLDLERGGTFADRYEIIEEVGKGGMGRVYKVFDRKVKENVALKLLKPEIAADPRTIERFRNELKFARKIAHPRVCRMYDLGEIGQLHFITMEYVSGEDLKSFIRRAGHLSEAKALSVAGQITDGLAEAHRLGVLHRDLKPQNIMIDREGNAKVMDFGIARSLHAVGFTGSGIMVGTPEYMSPEQAEAAAVDPRSDLYSLGIIIYEMVTGKVPFSGETPLSVALKQKTEAPRDPRELNAAVSEDLSRLILKCLEKDKDKRYQSAPDLAVDLDRIGKGLPTAERAVILKPTRAPGHRPRTRLRRFVVPAVIVLAGAYLVVTLGRQSTREGGHGPRLRVDVARSPGPESPPARPGFPPLEQATAPRSGADRQVPELIARWLDKLGGVGAQGGKAASGIISPILRGAIDDMNPRDLDEAQKQMERLRQFIPQDSHYQAIWSEAYGKIKESKRRQEAGQPRASEESLAQGQNQMRRLLDLVDQKEKADAARSEMDLARGRADAILPPDVPNPLYKLAFRMSRDAAEAYAKEDFAGAATLYKILAKAYDLSPAAPDEEGGASLLLSYLKAVKLGATAAGAQKLAAWHYEEAAKEESNGAALAARKDFTGAADAFLRAAFLYERAREKAQSGAAP